MAIPRLLTVLTRLEAFKQRDVWVHSLILSFPPSIDIYGFNEFYSKHGLYCWPDPKPL